MNKIWNTSQIIRNTTSSCILHHWWCKVPLKATYAGPIDQCSAIDQYIAWGVFCRFCICILLQVNIICVLWSRGNVYMVTLAFYQHGASADYSQFNCDCQSITLPIMIILMTTMVEVKLIVFCGKSLFNFYKQNLCWLGIQMLFGGSNRHPQNIQNLQPMLREPAGSAVESDLNFTGICKGFSGNAVTIIG